MSALVKPVASVSAPLPTELPVLAVLGLTSPENGDWLRLRGLQYASLAMASRLRIVTHAIAACSAFAVLYGAVNTVALIVWLAVLSATVVSAIRRDQAMADADRRLPSNDEVSRHTTNSAFLALVWVVPLVLASQSADVQATVKLWSVLAMLMTTSAIVLPSAPMTTILFSVIVGGAAVANFGYTQAYDMAGLSAAFCATVIAGTIEAARNDLLARIAEVGLAEKSEVVSLLLREFEEEGEADWLWQIDTSRRVRAVSPRFAYALGVEPAAVEGHAFIQLIAGAAWESGQFPPSLHDLTERLTRRESFSNLLVRVSINAEQRWWELSGTPKLDENGAFEGFRGVGSDVTEQRESSDKIAYLARYDTLTGLPNRMMLTDALAEALRHSQQSGTRCAFLMIDLDRFKAVNDTLGHLVGDQLLAKVSERLKELTTVNELCGRLGGDEFAVVIRDASDIERVHKVARLLIDRLSQPYHVAHHTLSVGASVGSAIGPRDGSTVEVLMRNADLALYRAKDEGGGVHFDYEPSLHAHAEERRKLEFSLRHALERNEFALNFQPVVDAVSEDLVSFEALIRWNSAEHGIVSPAKFIPLAEDARLMVAIGEWVLREACRQATGWPGHIKVAVNVSGEQLIEANFVSSVVSALTMSGLPAQRLELEVTESIFLRDPVQARAALEQIMALGCNVALDDFGTGYSSLGYIRNLCFSTIKVDRSFVQGAATGNRESLAIIRAVVAMADSLEMSTTAEGVETEVELDVVRKLGCKKVQGYYYGRPMESVDVDKLFNQRRFAERAEYS